MRTVHGDTGSGSILAVAILAATVLLASVAVPAVGLLAGQQLVQNAADAAALAAADTLSGRTSGYPCPNAARAAELDGARLDSCELDGSVAVVAVSRARLAITLTARARAGPPGTG
jgi:secretion/DNA translocation related TadE-like protein